MMFLIELIKSLSARRPCTALPATWRTPAARSPSAARTSDPDDFHRRGFVRDPLAVRISTAADAWAANEGVHPDERRGAVRRRLRRALLSVRQVVRLGEPLRADRHTPTPRRSPAAGLRSPHTPLDRAPRRHSRRRWRPSSRPRRPGIAPRTVRLRLACRPVACVAAARTPFSITLHTPCRQSQRRHRLSTRENAAKLRLPHALDFPPPQITLVTTEMPVGASS